MFVFLHYLLAVVSVACFTNLIGLRKRDNWKQNFAENALFVWIAE